MQQIDRREFTGIILSSIILPGIVASPVGDSSLKPDQFNEPLLEEARMPAIDFKYSSEITHHDIHELEYASEQVYRRIKTYHSDDRLVASTFKEAFQASYDFHSHMHSEFEEDHARTREAFDLLVPVFERLDDSTRKKDVRHYFEELKGWYENLKIGIVA